MKTLEVRLGKIEIEQRTANCNNSLTLFPRLDLCLTKNSMLEIKNNSRILNIIHFRIGKIFTVINSWKISDECSFNPVNKALGESKQVGRAGDKSRTKRVFMFIIFDK